MCFPGVRRRDLPSGMGDGSRPVREGRHRRATGRGARHRRRRARVHVRQRVPGYVSVSCTSILLCGRKIDKEE